jgi:HAD superfamily hydrolase (TIGR01509 family)
MIDRPPFDLHAILFDLDATLADSRGVYQRAFQEVFRQVLHIELTPEVRKKFMGLPTRAFLAEYSNGRRLEELVQALDAALQALMPEIRLFPGFEVALPELHSAGLKLAVVTSQNRAECLATRRYLQIDDFIQEWITVEDTANPKPHPQPILLALERLAVRPGQALMIGDSEFDLQSARAAGVHLGAALWGAADPQALQAFVPDVVFARPLDLLALLKPVDRYG